MVGGGGYPIQSWWGGTPSTPGRGYPIQSWLGGGTPSSHGRGTPSSHGGLPHPDLAGGGVVPQVPPLLPRPAGAPPSPPPSGPGWGTPHHPDLAGVPPPSPSRPDRDTPYPPPPTPRVDVWTDKQTENSTFPHPSDADGKYGDIHSN